MSFAQSGTLSEMDRGLLAAVAALGDVIGCARNDNAGRAGH